MNVGVMLKAVIASNTEHPLLSLCGTMPELQGTEPCQRLSQMHAMQNGHKLCSFVCIWFWFCAEIMLTSSAFSSTRPQHMIIATRDQQAGCAGLHLHWDRLFSTVFALGQTVQQAVALGQAVQELTQLPILWILNIPQFLNS